jgi:predicted acetyltransferase
MERLRLVTPDANYKKQYLDFIEACGEDIIKHEMQHYIPLSNEFTFLQDINSLINVSKGIGLPAGWVSASTFWLINVETKRIIGVINIRHELTDYLRFRGGHIAYYIHTEERRKGYASKMLELGLKVCKDLGISKVLITCAKENIGSVKTIINNGGVLHSEDKDGKVVFQRYWIELSDR